MNDEYIVLSKSKIKRIFCGAAAVAVTVIGVVCLFLSKPFLGFGYHNFAEQLFRLILSVLMPMIIMTSTDCFITGLLNKQKTAYAVLTSEAVLICVKNCYSFLCSFSGELFGFTEKGTVIFLTIAFHILFLILLLSIQIFVLHKYLKPARR